MGYYPRERTRGVGGAVAIHLSIYCVVVGCLAYGLHALLEPTQLANPGVSAYKPPPQTVIAYLPARSQDAPQPVAPVAEPQPEPEPATTATTEAKPPAAAAEKRKRTAKAEKPRRARSAKVRRDPRMDYAYQPFFWGGYRPWY